MEMIVRLTGEIDCATGSAVEAELVRTMAENGADVVADLGAVSFLDCAGLGSLVAVRRWAAEHGLRFRIARPAPAVQRLLDAVEPTPIELLSTADGDSARAWRDGSGVVRVGASSPTPDSAQPSPPDEVWRRLEVASEELLVADEEVRTQQELIDNLLRGRTAERLAATRLAAALPIPLVGTDRDGVVRDANPAAAALLRIDAERLRGKPLAVLVHPADRRALRSALTRAAGTGYPEHLEVSLTPRREGIVPVHLAVLAERNDDEPVGRAGGSPLLRFVIAPQGSADPSVDGALLTALGSAARLSTLDTDLHAVLARLAGLAAQGVTDALSASIAIGPPAAPEVLVSTDQTAQEADGEQHRAGTGPTWEAYATGRPVVATSLHADERWPALRGPVPPGADGVAAVPLMRAGGEPAGVLTVYGTAGLAEDAEVGRTALFADAAAALLREHRAIAELRLQEAQLREALASRAVIEQAKGILMAQRGIDADDAFRELVRRSQHSNVKLRVIARQLVAEASSAMPPAVRQSGAGSAGS